MLENNVYYFFVILHKIFVIIKQLCYIFKLVNFLVIFILTHNSFMV